MAKKRKQNKFGHAFVCEWLGTEWFRDDQGKITNEEGNYAGDKFNQIINEQYPIVAPVELEKKPKKKAKVSTDDAKPTPEQAEAEKKPKKRGRKKKEEEPKEKTTRLGRFSRAILKDSFPGLYEKAESFRELWTGKDRKDLSVNPFNYKPLKTEDNTKEPVEGKNKEPGRLARFGKAALKSTLPGIYDKTEAVKKLWKGDDKEQNEKSEQKRQATEKRFQYTRVEDSLKDNADLLRDVISIQERSSELLSQIAAKIGKGDTTTGNDTGGNKGYDWKKLLGKGRGVLGTASALMALPTIDKDNVDTFLNPDKPEKKKLEDENEEVKVGGVVVERNGQVIPEALKDPKVQAARKMAMDMGNPDPLSKYTTPQEATVPVVEKKKETKEEQNRPPIPTAPVQAIATPAPTTPQATPSAPPPATTGESLAQKAETSNIEEARNRGPEATVTPELISYKADQIKFNADKLTFEVQSLNVEMKPTTGQQVGATGGNEGGPSAAAPSTGGTGTGGSGGTGESPGGAPGVPQAAQTGAPSVAGPAGQQAAPSAGAGMPNYTGGPGVTSSTQQQAPTYAPSNGRQNAPSAAPEASPEAAPSSGSNKPLAGGKSFTEQAPDVMAKLQKDFGLSKEQAAGVVGNLGHESAGLQAGIQEKGVKQGRGGLGWAQWTGPRRKEFEKYLKETGQEATDPNANYGFLKKELETTHKSTIAAVKKTNNVTDATVAVEKHYEAAGIKHMDSRIKYANQAVKATDEAEKKKTTEEAKAQVAQKDAEKKESVEPAGTTSAPAVVQQQQAEATKASKTTPNQTPPAPPPEVAKKLDAQTETPAAKAKVAVAATSGTEQTRAAKQLSTPPIIIAAGGNARPAMTEEDKKALAGEDLTKPEPDATKLPGGDEGLKDRDIRSANMMNVSNTVEKEESAAALASSEIAGYETSFDVGTGSQDLQPVAESIPMPPTKPAELTSPTAESTQAAAPAPAAKTSGSDTSKVSQDRPAHKPNTAGEEFIGKLAKTLPYLAMAVITGQQQALHSQNQHLKARR
jgi:hypothetical protein